MIRSHSIPEKLIKIKAHQFWEKRQLEEIDGTPGGDWREARHYLEKHRQEVFLWRLNRPFIWIEKRIIEPLDRWSDRANIFNFFSKLSPIIEAIGVLAIPFVIFYFENQREERQLRFEENLISAQTEVRHQQAVRDYLSQVTTIHLETDQGREIKEDEELRTLLQATTLALFNELSVREVSSRELGRDIEEVIKLDRKGQVVKFLSGLGWINDLNGEEPLLSLQEANLRIADLRDADLRGADLQDANLIGADLRGANFDRAVFRDANLDGANLDGANLNGANLDGADLQDANLIGADLRGANLGRTNIWNLDLQDAQDAYLRDLRDQDADLRDLYNAYLHNADLRGADLRADLRAGLRFDLRSANLDGADLRIADLNNADLNNAYLHNADLRGADLRGADLRTADLRGANLDGANLNGANLDGIQNLTSTQIKSACFWDQAIYEDKLYWNKETKTWVAGNEQAKQDNAKFIEKLKNDKSSDPEKPADCSWWQR